MKRRAERGPGAVLNKAWRQGIARRSLLYQLSYITPEGIWRDSNPRHRHYECSPASIRHDKRKGDDKGLARKVTSVRL